MQEPELAAATWSGSGAVPYYQNETERIRTRAGTRVTGINPQKIDTHADLTDQLVTLFNSGGWSIHRLAEASGLSTATIHGILDGTTAIPQAKILVEFVRACGEDPQHWLSARGRAARSYRLELKLARPSPKAGDLPSDADVVIPRQLPPNVSQFTGRSEQLLELDSLLKDARRTPAAIVVSSVSGTAGVGKTALAVSWAHLVKKYFPDGQLYIDLRGYGPEEPMSPSDATTTFLRALGVSDINMPNTVAEKAALYRTLLDNRRALIVLDNARTEEQVRSLLPGTATCFVVVTSRDSLPGLVARDGARRIELDLLTLAEATDLLNKLIGAHASAEPDEIVELAHLCSRLPLALRIAAEIAIARPSTPIRELICEISEKGRRLDAMDAGGDPYTAARAVFSWSFKNLTPDAARLFRLIGLHPGHAFSVQALMALSGSEERSPVDTLHRAHLIAEEGPNRYLIHDLLHEYAAELVTEVLNESEQDAAHQRISEYYLQAASNAAALVYRRGATSNSDPDDHSASVTIVTYNEAALWLDSERENIIALTESSNAVLEKYTLALAAEIFEYLEIRGYYDDIVTLCLRALKITRKYKKRETEALTCNQFGSTLYSWDVTTTPSTTFNKHSPYTATPTTTPAKAPP